MKIEQLGPYQIVRELGRGGMGIVYEGVNLETDEPAAVKLLSGKLALERGFRERFAAEIETLRKLNHPNIVRLFGFGDQDEHLFYAMELVHGSSLEEELQRGRRFNWREVTRIGIETCRALRHAHDRGVIHRDIKPGNLLMTDDGHVKLSDFGIARFFGNTRMTYVGSVLGTAEYMAPEQAEGGAVGPRTDLYSLGGVLFVLLTRRPLFQAQSLPEVLHKQRFERPDPVRRHVPDVPAFLEEIIAQLLEKDPDRRIPNPAVLARQLEAMEQALSLEPDERDEGDRSRLCEAGHRPQVGRGPFRQTGPVPNSHGGPADANPTPPAADSAQPDAGQLPPTRVDDESAGQPPASDPSIPSADDLPDTKVSGAFKALETAEAAEEEPKVVGHFTTVEKDELDRIESKDARTAWVSPQTWVLVGGLIAVGLAVWYFLQHPSDDALYEKITTQVASGSPDSLLGVEDEIHEFLMRYAGDRRCEELRKYEKEIELEHLEQKFRLLAKGLAGTEDLEPVERDYLEAINYARLDPESGVAKLQALVDLYGQGGETSGRTENCVELARRRLMGLRRQLDRQAAAHLALVRDQLDRAEQLSRTEPNRARKMYRAVIELYQDKPWAAEAVRQARAALETGSSERP